MLDAPLCFQHTSFRGQNVPHPIGLRTVGECHGVAARGGEHVDGRAVLAPGFPSGVHDHTEARQPHRQGTGDAVRDMPIDKRDGSAKGHRESFQPANAPIGRVSLWATAEGGVAPTSRGGIIHIMQRVATTVLALVGAPPVQDLRALAASLGETVNIRAVLPEADAPPLDRAVAAWGEAAHAHIPYLVHDADPLTEVSAAWVERWEGTGDPGRLEVAIHEVLRRWRARSLELPDYYLLVDAEALPPTWRHWYLGVLAASAVHRIVVVGPDPVEVVGAVRELTAGRWWPQLDALLADVDRRVPDALPLGEPATGLVL